MRKPRQPGKRLQFFDTPEELLEAVAQSNARMQAAPTTDWQQEMKPGDHFVRLMEVGGHDVDVYGEVLDIKDEEDAALLRSRPDLRMCMCYSKLCPDGEMGTVFISTMSYRISRDLFRVARAMGWPLFYQAFGETVE
jgi:hypothetical protein